MAEVDSVRVHAVILTRDRPEVLERSVDTAVMKMTPCDVLTVLDDSSLGVVEENAAVLATVAHKSPAMVTHLIPARLYEEIADVTVESAPAWQSRTAPRDIAPLRNLALLLSTAVRARTTVLIDDDICGFDLEMTHKHLKQLTRGSQGVIVGVEIGGQSEMDTLTRLRDALRRVKLRQVTDETPLDELFSITVGQDGVGDVDYGVVSAGYMAFNIHPTQVFAFPPGYNEDWLWCLMHNISGRVRVVRSEQLVQHAPPRVRRSTYNDVLFEIAGDLVWDCLTEYLSGDKRPPIAALCALACHTPSREVLPTARVGELLEVVRKSTLTARLHSYLNACGLRAVEAVMRSGELATNERMILTEWCKDAIAKHKSFSGLPANETVQRVIAKMTVEGRK